MSAIGPRLDTVRIIEAVAYQAQKAGEPARTTFLDAE